MAFTVCVIVSFVSKRRSKHETKYAQGNNTAPCKNWWTLQSPHWPPCEWTVTLPNFPRLCWLSAVLSFQTSGNRYSVVKLRMYQDQILNSKYEVFLWLLQRRVHPDKNHSTFIEWAARLVFISWTTSLTWMLQLWKWCITPKMRFDKTLTYLKARYAKTVNTPTSDFLSPSHPS